MTNTRQKEQPTIPYETGHDATFRSEHTTTIPDRRPLPAFATTAVATAFAATRPRNETPRIAATSPETHHSPSESIKLEFSAPLQKQTLNHERSSSAEAQRKIEHMPLLQLLSMAENVDIGHGQYLRREFESGRIDKEGLVKILKAQSKGRDYRFEFHQQASRFAKLKEMSPEFLHLAKPKNDMTEVYSDGVQESAETKARITPEKRLETARPLSLAPPARHDLLPELADSIHKPEHTGRRLMLITLAAVAGLALVGLLAITLYNALS